MKLTLTLTDDQIRVLDETLRVSYSAYKVIHRYFDQDPIDPILLESSQRIIQVRHLLEMNACPDRACYDCPEEVKRAEHFEITCVAP